MSLFTKITAVVNNHLTARTTRYEGLMAQRKVMEKAGQALFADTNLLVKVDAALTKGKKNS